MHYRVTITEVTAGRPRHTTTVEATDTQDAINQACVALWGGLAWWHPNHGRPHYGQVFRHRRVATPTGGFRDDGADSVTVEAHLLLEEHHTKEGD